MASQKEKMMNKEDSKTIIITKQLDNIHETEGNSLAPEKQKDPKGLTPRDECSYQRELLQLLRKTQQLNSQSDSPSMDKATSLRTQFMEMMV